MTRLAAWRQHMGWPQRRAADALGVTLATYQQWENEVSRHTGEHVEPPLTALLAAAALEAGLAPISL